MSHSSNHTSVEPEQFSMRFRMLMSYHNLTLKDIAEHTQNAVSTVGTWKNGRVPSSEVARNALANIFHVSVNFLLYGKCEPENVERESAMYSVLNSIDSVVGEPDGQSEVREPAASLKQDEVPYRRDLIERYLKQFLDQAESEPGGLAHTWYHLRREFPLDLFSRLH